MKTAIYVSCVVVLLAYSMMSGSCSSGNTVSSVDGSVSDYVQIEVAADGRFEAGEVETSIDNRPCEPQCGAVECGPDPICGLSCGECGAGQECVAGTCAELCTETCAGLGCECGEVCGHSCGQCANDEHCLDGCKCSCMPQCGGKECGDDGCGGSCGKCPIGHWCQVNGTCLEPPPCAAEQCPPNPGPGDWEVYCNSKNHCEYRLVDGDPHDIEIYVPPGAFEMGAPDGDYFLGDYARPRHVVTLQEGVFIDKFETTYGQFMKCRDEGVCPDPTGCDYLQLSECDMFSAFSPFWDKEAADVVPGFESRPVVGVTPDEARVFCNWRGKSVITEAIWERAARGPSSFMYPWGDTPEPDCESVGIGGCSEEEVLDVGSFPQDISPVGAMDMHGNAYEVVIDRWWNTYGYNGAPTDGSPWGPFEIDSYFERVVRGQSIREKLSVGLYRRQSDSWTQNHDRSFRCARW